MEMATALLEGKSIVQNAEVAFAHNVCLSVLSAWLGYVTNAKHLQRSTYLWKMYTLRTRLNGWRTWADDSKRARTWANEDHASPQLYRRMVIDSKRTESRVPAWW